MEMTQAARQVYSPNRITVRLILFSACKDFIH